MLRVAFAGLLLLFSPSSAFLPPFVKDLEKLVCDEMKKGGTEQQAVTFVCGEISKQLPTVPEAECEMAAKLAWSQVLTKCPAPQLHTPAVGVMFENFVRGFGKVYKSADERAKRLAIFAENYLYIQEENLKGHKYTLGVNEFSDLTPEEFRTGYLNYKRPSHKNLWGGMPHLGTHQYSGAPLADSVDWTTKGAVTPVKNQGQCGACWAFSSTGSMEGAWQIKTGSLVSLSEQQLVDCSKNGNKGCNGGSMDNAFTFEEKQQVCTEASYPYTAKNGHCKTSCTAGIPAHGVTGFKDVTENDMQALMEAVAQQPVSVAIEADQRAFQSYKSGVLTQACGTKLDHGVLAVGYGSDAEVNADYWKVKNSWGASWGEKGYIRMERKSGKGECGIDMQPSYPVVSGAPGPSPGPSPPSPPSPPTPPGTTHYEKPPCQADETEASVQGAQGSVCAPSCDSGPCPTDVPEGTKAKPKCILQDSSSGKKYCALSCSGPFSGCPSGAKCSSLFGGICTYPDTGKAVPAFMKVTTAWPNLFV